MTEAEKAASTGARKRLDALDYVGRIEFGLLFRMEADAADPREPAAAVAMRALDKLALYGSKAKATAQ